MPNEISLSPFRSTAEREQERVAKREALLVAAVRMFNERGFHGTSLDEVAASLGVTKPVIYHYLGNKDKVLLECVRVGLRQLQDAADQASQGGGDGLAQLRRFLARYADVIMNDFGRCIVLTGDGALSPEGRAEFRSLKRQIDRNLRTFIERAATDGSIEPVDVRMASFAVAGALNWTAHWHSPEGALTATDIADQLIHILTHGLIPRPAVAAGEVAIVPGKKPSRSARR